MLLKQDSDTCGHNFSTICTYVIIHMHTCTYMCIHVLAYNHGVYVCKHFKLMYIHVGELGWI